MVVGETSNKRHFILKQVALGSGKYNLGLNFEKCSSVGMDGSANTNFQNGKPMRKLKMLSTLEVLSSMMRIEQHELIPDVNVTSTITMKP